MSGDRPGVSASFVNSRGLRLQTKTWHPEGDPCAVVLFLHGWGMSVTNNKAWQRVANTLTTGGLLCTGLDYSGHGESEGRRSYIHAEDLSLTVEDVLQHVDDVMQRHPGLPVFARTQSLGGLVGVLSALGRPSFFQGLALGAPPFELAGLFGALDRWNLVRWHAIPTAAARVRESVGGLTAPLAVFQGLEDGTCAPQGARRLVQSAGSTDKSLYLYKDMGHNMSIEPDVLEWLSARTNGANNGGVRLCIRRPIPGCSWPPRPGEGGADENTELEVVPEPEQQRVLEEVLPLGKAAEAAPKDCA